MRVKRGYVLRRRHNRWLKLAKGQYGSRHTLWKTAHQSVVKALRNAYDGRRDKKNDFRRLWIGRISAACKLNGTNYSSFMHGLIVAKVNLNRKMLSEIAIADPAQFAKLVEISKKALGDSAKTITAPNAGVVGKIAPRAAVLPVKAKAKHVVAKKAEAVAAPAAK